MDNIIELFKENSILITFKYYGSQDIGSGWDIKYIIDNKEVFKDFYNQFPLTSVDSIEEYYIFLLTEKFINLEELVPNIVDDSNKKIVQKLVDEAKTTIKNINNRDVIKYINSDYANLFDEDLYTYDVPYRTFELIVK